MENSLTALRRQR